jgi:hypothetical protein
MSAYRCNGFASVKRNSAAGRRSGDEATLRLKDLKRKEENCSIRGYHLYKNIT